MRRVFWLAGIAWLAMTSAASAQTIRGTLLDDKT